MNKLKQSTVLAALGLALLAAALVLAGCGPDRNKLADEIAAYEPSDLADMDAAVIAQYRQIKAQALSALQGKTTREEKAQAVGRLGGWYYVFRLNDAALELLQYAAEFDPNDTTWPALLGHLEKRRGNIEAARYWWGLALELQPGQLAWKVQLAEILMEENRFEEAETMLHEMMQGRRGNARILYDLGKLALERGEAAEAVPLFNRALMQQPESGAILYQLGVAYRMLGDEQRAQRHLASAEQSAGDDQLPPMGDPAMALLQDFRHSARHHADRAKNLWDDGKQEEALRMIQRAVSAAPDRAIYRLRLASYLERMGRTLDAKRAFERVLQQEPDNLRAMNGLARSERRLGHPGQARNALEALVKRHPMDTRGLTELALSYNRDGRHEEALELLDRAVQQDPRAEMARLWQIWTLVVSDRTEEALSRAEEGVQLLPDSYLLEGMMLRLQIHCEPEPCGGTDHALARATDRFRSTPNLYAGETLAMVTARSGDFEEAARIQRAIARSVMRSQNQALITQVADRLRDYESGIWPTVMWTRLDTLRPSLSVSVAVRDRPPITD